MRRAELDRNVCAGGLAKVIIHVDSRMNGEAVLGRELLDQLAHLAIADNCEFRMASYSNGAGSNAA